MIIKKGTLFVKEVKEFDKCTIYRGNIDNIFVDLVVASSSIQPLVMEGVSKQGQPYKYVYIEDMAMNCEVVKKNGKTYKNYKIFSGFPKKEVK